MATNSELVAYRGDAAFKAAFLGEIGKHEAFVGPIDAHTLGRFLNHVSYSDSCWLWTGGQKGREPAYGCFWLSGKHKMAHRVVMALTTGSLPIVKVLHRCDTPLCVRPSHLRLGTLRDNSIEMSTKGRNGQHRHPERRPHGESHGAAKLSVEDVWQIRAALSTGEGNTSLARTFDVSERQIRRIGARERWSHLRELEPARA